MPSQQDIAPHIEELTRALQGTVPEEKIRQQLERYIEYGVPLHQAKKDILTTFSGGKALRKNVSNIAATDQSVDVLVRVLSVQAREVTARGEPTTIWEGEIADETGRIRYTSWVDHDLKPGQVAAIKDAYIRTWQGAPQLNIGDRTEIETRSDDVLPPADELRQTEPVAAPAPTGGGEEFGIADLEPGQRSVIVQGRLLTVNERTVNVKGEPTTIWEGEIADETGRIAYTSWHDHGLEPGQVVRIENGYVRTFRSMPQLNFGDNSIVQAIEGAQLPPADELRTKDKPMPTGGDPTKIKALAPGMSNLLVKGRLLKVNERTVNVKGEPKTLWEGEIADETGRVQYTSWHDHGLERDQVVRIDNAYVRSFRGLAQLNFGESSPVTQLDDDELPPLTELKKDVPYTIGELERIGGAIGVRLDAVVLEVRDGSGLIQRCPECRRVLQKRECRIHGRVEGISDLRIKAVVDDGTGAVTAIFDRPLTEEVLGRDLEACQKAAQEAMSREVIADELEEKLLLRRVVLTGNATHDDYGTTLIVDEVRFEDVEDVAARAEALFDKAQALSEEVVA